MHLPKTISLVKVPPIKCQGIKTKLVPFIAQSIEWKPGKKGRWVEPFLGSGVVALNLLPEKAILSDTNKHIIAFYQSIQNEQLTGTIVREYLIKEGAELKLKGKEHYYFIRDRFNSEHSSYDFLFLNRACFNGVMRFNSKGGFNVPFCHKPERFAQSYVTKIVNQVNWAASCLKDKDWEFRVSTWEETLTNLKSDDFVYLDPPYIGRHTDYFNSWDQEEAEKLAQIVQELPCGFALSMWLSNKYRTNTHIQTHWNNLEQRVFSHFYHVGSNESLRNEMIEALLIKPGFAFNKMELENPRVLTKHLLKTVSG